MFDPKKIFTQKIFRPKKNFRPTKKFSIEPNYKFFNELKINNEHFFHKKLKTNDSIEQIHISLEKIFHHEFKSSSKSRNRDREMKKLLRYHR